jgi:hypothetical protein
MPKITPHDVVVPSGNLFQVMFRGYNPEQFTESVTAFVTEAGRKTKAVVDDYDSATGERLETLREAEKAYAYYEAFKRLAALHANLAAQASEVNLSATYTNNARENRILASSHLETWQSLLAAPKPASAKPRRSSSQMLEPEF